MRIHFRASVFLQTFAIAEIIVHIVNMLKILVYLGNPALSDDVNVAASLQVAVYEGFCNRLQLSFHKAAEDNALNNIGKPLHPSFVAAFGRLLKINHVDGAIRFHQHVFRLGVA